MNQDQRGRFIVAQQLIAEGRTEEARLVLRTLSHVPEAQSWAEQLERGDPIDPNSLTWDIDAPFPLPTIDDDPKPRRQWQPFRTLMILVMMFSLVAPFIPWHRLESTSDNSAQIAAERSIARQRVQQACYQWIDSALDNNIPLDQPTSCMEWSYSLTAAMMQDALICHRHYPDTLPDFMRCLQSINVQPLAIIDTD